MGVITIINTTPYKEQPVPEVGKEYHIFDDGKIKPSRHYSAKVLEIIPFKKNYSIDDPMCAVAVAWRENVLEYEFLFAQETDYFIKAESSFDKNPLYFVRTLDGGWFSINYPDFWMGARLDIDGSLYKRMIEMYGGID